MNIKGRVILKVIARHSKSEHEAVGLEVNSTTVYLLRQRGKNAFHNPELEALVGKELEASGELVGNVFFVRNYTVTGDV